jgi:ATP-dependent helicase/nuclease subunit A
VADVTAMLRLLVNPHDDLSLVTVLRSPLVGASDDSLYLLGRAARQARARSLWEAVREGRAGPLDPGDRQKLADLMNRLQELRKRVGRPGLSRLIDDAVSASGYDLYLLASREGSRGFANLRKLMKMAAEFETLEGPDLARFVQLLDSLGGLGDDEGNAPSLAEGEQVVRVMTVHQAKGLEFPVVILGGLGSDPPRDKQDDIVLARDGRAGVLLRTVEKTRYEDHPPHWGPVPEVLAEESLREREEDVRLLYVAMTRAKERLILVGARPPAGRSDARRIGRIVTALGLEALPAAGTVVTLDGLSAAVIGVTPPDSEGEDWDEETGTGGAGPADAAPAIAEPVGVGRREQARLSVQSRQLPEVCVSKTPPASSVPPIAEPASLLRLPAPALTSGQLSFSALASYGRCPRRFYLDRVLGLAFLERVADERDDAGPAGVDGLDDQECRAGRDVGLLVHALLERADLTAGPPTEGKLRQEAGSLLSAFGLHLPDASLRRALCLVRAFWESPLCTAPDLGVALREQPFFFVQGDTTIHGVMDLLLQRANAWLIVDYKSNHLGGADLGEIAESYRLQAAIYSLAALKAGAPAARMEFIFLERPHSPAVFEYSAEERSQLEGSVDTVLAGIKEGRFPPALGNACADCHVGDLCRVMAWPVAMI